LATESLETADRSKKPARVPLSGLLGPMTLQVPERLLPVCEMVTRAGPLPAAWLLVMVPLQVPLSEGVDGPVATMNRRRQRMHYNRE
jgi:hypothetical protein